MNLKLFTFSKKPNSTKRPDLSSGTSFDCTLIENTSLISPSIRLKGVANMTGKEKVTVTNTPLVSFTDGVRTDFDEIVTQINVVQEGSGDPSPSNVRPISGFTGLTVHVADGVTPHVIDNTYPITWQTEAGTVYGGSLDVTSGVLTVTHGYKLFSDLSWTIHNTYANTYYANVPDIKASSVQTSSIVNAVVSAYKVVSRSAQINNPNVNNFSLSATNAQGGRVFALDDSYETQEAFENGTANYQLVYELATPQTFQLSPIAIPQNEGANNLWCNTGNILSCTYEKYVPVTAYMYKFNYAYLQEMDRYYFITDIRYELGTWVFDLKCDTLASWKTYIGSGTHYVLRASSAYDGRIIDTAYPTKVKQTTQEVYSNYTLFGNYYTDTMTCYYIVGIIGAINPSDLSDATDVYNGSVVYFCLTKSQMYELIFSLLDNVDLYNIDSAEMSKQLQKQLINPIQYIHSIKCVPVTPNLVKDGSLNNIVATGFYAGFQFVPITSYTPTPPTP